MKGKTNPGIMEKQRAASIHSGVAPLQPRGRASTRMTTWGVTGSPCVWSVLWILQPPFAEGAALCGSLGVLGRDWSEASTREDGAEEGKKHRRWDRKLLRFPSHPWEGSQTFPPLAPPPHRRGAAKTACLNSRGCRPTPTCATDSPTSGWETAQQCCSN